jgi:hypothetical protein
LLGGSTDDDGFVREGLAESCRDEQVSLQAIVL